MSFYEQFISEFRPAEPELGTAGFLKVIFLFQMVEVVFHFWLVGWVVANLSFGKHSSTLMPAGHSWLKFKF